jgi:poly(A) polymerase
VSEASEAKREDAVAIVRRLRDAGHVAYFAGGCVRDMLLGLEPKDYDVATDAPPERVRQLFSSTQAVGAAFGVILVRQRKSQSEVATFRTDLAYKDGRRPEGVVFTTAEEDAKRRDFTINGMFFDPIENRVIDYVGGQGDLKNRVLRAIGEPNHRFEEDHLRLLRAVRFAARFNLEIEPTTADAIRRHAEQLKRISPERIAEELRLMLTGATRVKAYRLLWEFGLIDVISRFVKGGTDAAYERGIFEALFNEEGMSFGLALAAASLDYRWQRAGSPQDIRPMLSKSEIRATSSALRQALKISNDEAEVVEGSLAFAQLIEDESPSVATRKRFLMQTASDDARRLMGAVAQCGMMYGRIGLLLAEFRQLEQTDFAPPPLVSGDDLTAAGLQPGPVFKRVLDAVYDAQLEGRVTSKEAALEMALSLANQ